MHTALVSRLLRDRTLWEEATQEAGGVNTYVAEPQVRDSAV
jgi:hypothetical protein